MQVSLERALVRAERAAGVVEHTVAVHFNGNGGWRWACTCGDGVGPWHTSANAAKAGRRHVAAVS